MPPLGTSTLAETNASRSTSVVPSAGVVEVMEGWPTSGDGGGATSSGADIGYRADSAESIDASALNAESSERFSRGSRRARGAGGDAGESGRRSTRSAAWSRVLASLRCAHNRAQGSLIAED